MLATFSFVQTVATVALVLASCAPTSPTQAAIRLTDVPLASIETSTGPRPGRIANYYLMSRMTPDMVEGLARYDLLILGLENAVNNREILDAIKSRRPEIKMLFYVQTNEFPWNGYHSNEPADGPWHGLLARLDTTRHFLAAPDGRPAQFWPGTRSYNMCDPEVAQILARWITEQFSVYPWDGVFCDNVWSYDMTWYCSGNVDWDHDRRPDDMADFSRRWIANLDYLGRLVRHHIGSDRLLIGNIGGDRGGDHRFWTGVANGRMFEGFPNTLPLSVMAQAYLDPTIAWQSPGMTIVHCEAGHNLNDVRFAWYFTLLGNGYFAVDDGPNSGPDGDNGWHDELRWYAELYALDHGRPLTRGWQDARSGMWFREFEQAILAWNPMPTPTRVKLVLRDGRGLDLNVPPVNGGFYPKPAP